MRSYDSGTNLFKVRILKSFYVSRKRESVDGIRSLLWFSKMNSVDMSIV